MARQTKTFEEKTKMVVDFFENQNISNSENENLKFDFRGYQKFLDENNVHGLDVKKDIIDKFISSHDELDDAKLLALVTLRMQNTDLSKTISQEEAMRILGITQAELDEMDDVEIE